MTAPHNTTDAATLAAGRVTGAVILAAAFVLRTIARDVVPPAAVPYPLSLRHLEEMMSERGIAVDHSTVHR